MPSFVHEGNRLHYRSYPAEGRGSRRGPSRPVVLIHGLLLSERMHMPLAKALARRGNHVVAIDLLGHGASDRPRDMWRYSMTFFGEQVVGLLDHLEVDEAALMGTSLGANTALEVAAIAPERVRGMVVEMPVLDNALLGCALAFTPALVALTFGEPLMRALSSVTNMIPRRGLPFYLDVGLDWIRQEPGPGGAVLQGIFFGRTAPHRSERRQITAPALVIGHRRDPVHPFSDAGMLAEELPNGRLIEANSMIELRLRPARLTAEIGDFLDECWQPKAARRQPQRRRAAG